MNLFRHISTLRAKKAASHEIDPEDVFLDSQNLSEMNIYQMEGHLERPISKHMFYALLLCSCVVVLGFSYRLFAMQVLQAEEYKEKANNNHLKKIPLFPLRGTISDRNGELLAWNSMVVPTKNKDGRSATSSNETERIQKSDDIPKRLYTATSGFSHVLGYVSYPKRDSSGVFWQEEYIGKDGIEKQYQQELSGVKGERIIEVTATREVEAQNVVVYPTNGENIILTIDSGLQEMLHKEIESLAHQVPFQGGAGVIMDITNGEILALTSYPEYDNNLMTNAITKEEKDQVAKDLLDKKRKFLQRAVGGLFTPGSTVKPYFAYAALNEGIIDEHKSIYSSGSLVIENKYGGDDTVFKDWRAHRYVNMRQAIAQSSDEYFYQIGGGYKDQKGLGIKKLNEYAKKFGFASTTGIDIPGEEYGVIPSPEWKKKVFGEDWLLGNTYHSSIGQYGFQVTPLELVRAVSAIANGGYLVQPHLLKRLQTESTSIGLDEKKLRVIQEGMRLAVTSDSGTVKALRIEGVSVAGKSGTAELGVSKSLVNSWTSGYFPYDKPKYAFVVIMEKGSRHNTIGASFVMKGVLEWMRDNTNYLDQNSSQ